MTTQTAQNPTEVTGRPYSGKTAPQRDFERRERLLEAGLNLFGSKSFAKTTVEELCGRAKVSTRHFYQTYDNKEGLFADVYDAATTGSSDRTQAALAATRGKPIVERITPAYLAYVSPMIEDPRIARIIFVSIIGISPTLESKRLAFREQLVTLICNEAAQTSELSADTALQLRFRALALAGATSTIIYDWVLQPGAQTVAQLQQALASITTLLLTTWPR